jgi:hypothetical protein
MIITESQLHRVIFEEVQLYLFEHEQNIDEALKDDIRKWFLPRTQDDPELAAYKQETRREFLKTLGKLAAVGATVGTLERINAFAQAKDSAAYNLGIETRKKEKAEYKKTDQYIIDEIEKVLSISANFQWTWEREGGFTTPSGEISFPAEFPMLVDGKWGGYGILSAEYGVYRALLDDIELQKDQEDKQPRVSPDEVVDGSGTAQQWSLQFPERYGFPRDSVRTYPRGLLRKALKQGFKRDVPHSRNVQGMLYLPIEDIPSQMIMPNSEMTPTGLYVDLWNKHVTKRGE